MMGFSGYRRYLMTIRPGRRKSPTLLSYSIGRNRCWPECQTVRFTSSLIPELTLQPTPTGSPVTPHPRFSSGSTGQSWCYAAIALLRAHVREEYEAVRDVAFPGQTPVLLLVPALPAAGRVTIDGIHSLEHNGRRVPLHKTEYASDGAFAYRSARLLDWADERSDGLFKAARGSELGLAELRSRGEVAVREMLETSDRSAWTSHLRS